MPIFSQLYILYCKYLIISLYLFIYFVEEIPGLVICTASVAGGKEIILLCEKVSKGLINIWSYLEYLSLNVYNI